MTDYLVDNSVWARLALGDSVVTARMCRIERAPADLFATCPPQVLGFCHNARTPGEYEQYRERISLGFPLEHARMSLSCWPSNQPCGAAGSFGQPARSTF